MQIEQTKECISTFCSSNPSYKYEYNNEICYSYNTNVIDDNSRKTGNIMNEKIIIPDKYKDKEFLSPSQIRYDIVGEISKGTGLTRKTSAEILSKISPEKFNCFKYNPEKFIKDVCNFINQEKSNTIVKNISYNKTDKKFDIGIFTINNLNTEAGNNILDNVKKHIYNILITDSKNETSFAKELETHEDVTVYAKLPRGFKISTPEGNYNPDWAIVFNNPSFKHIYFIAETKGSTNSSELRLTEDAKIKCAEKHFECISNGEVKYDVVDSYQSLTDKLLMS